MKLRGRKFSLGNRHLNQEIDEIERAMKDAARAPNSAGPTMLNDGEHFIDRFTLVGRDGDGLVAPSSATVEPIALALESAAASEEFPYASNQPKALVTVEDASSALPAIGTIGWASHLVAGSVTFTAPGDDGNDRLKVGRLVGTSVDENGRVEFDLAINDQGIGGF